MLSPPRARIINPVEVVALPAEGTEDKDAAETNASVTDTKRPSESESFKTRAEMLGLALETEERMLWRCTPSYVEGLMIFVIHCSACRASNDFNL